MAGNQSGKTDEGVWPAVAAVVIAVACIVTVVWLTSAHRVVYATSTALLWLGTPWVFLDPSTWRWITTAHEFFMASPKDVPFMDYVTYVNLALTPLSYFVMAAMALAVAHAFGSKSRGYRRKLRPMQLMEEITRTFTSIIPVMHLGEKLVRDELPLWRRQTFPEEVLQHVRIGGKPLVVDGEADSKRVEEYMMGEPVLRGTRLYSKTLGHQVVDLIGDAPQAAKICFPDRMSSQGKVIYALLAAHAFGGPQGKADYVKATDQLNRSCHGQANGLPNLTVAQWIFDKYRLQPKARQLFGIHHWEYTYLYALFFEAKKQGVCTHTDWIWLKPLDRVLFYVLNTTGRMTPHTEAAGAFSQYDFEVRAAKAKRLPVGKDGAPMIVVTTAVQALCTEWVRWRDGVDESVEWWENNQIFGAAEEAAMRIAIAEQASALAQATTVAARDPESTKMTQLDMELARQRDAEQANRLKADAADALGFLSGTD